MSVTVLCGLSGCAQFKSSHPEASDDKATSNPAESVIATAPVKPFEPETLYALLVAEFAGSEERYDLALGNYVQQAHKTRDAGVAARATRIARHLNAHQAALSTAQLWAELEPNNEEALIIATSELLESGQLQEAVRYAQSLPNDMSGPLYQSIAAHAREATDLQREQLIQQFEQAIAEHPDNLEIQVGLGILQQLQGNLQQALKTAQTVLQRQPDLIAAAVLEAKLLSQLKRPKEAMQRLATLVKRNPDNIRLRLHYARLLTDTDMNAAQKQFEQLVELAPNDPELIFSLALVYLKQEQWAKSEAQFQTLLGFPDHASSAHFYLGRIAAHQQKWELALSHLVQVQPGPDFMPAMLQTTDILVRSKQPDLAHQRLESAREAFPQESENFYLLEAEVLGRNQYTQQALDVLTEALEEFPQSVKLLYSRAMLSEKEGDLTQLQQDLRTLLKYDPNNVTALNALGYTLADRTQQYEEALQLITQALALKPDDPAIIDSMGWVQYRLGNHQAAIEYLRKAFAAFPDPEVAAHLGEVLWVTGQQAEAEQVWQQGLAAEPNNTLIPAVRQRLQGAQ